MDVQDKLLQKLDEYGQHFLEAHEVKKKKKKKNKQGEADSNDSDKIIDNAALTNDNSPVEKDPTCDIKKKKRRRRKKKKSDTNTNTNNTNNEVMKNKQKPAGYRGGAERHIEQIKRELGLDNFKEEQERKVQEQEMEKKNLSKGLKSKREPEIVVFHSRKTKEKEEQSENETEEKRPEVSHFNSGKEMDLETARHDVRKFGITGIKGKEKEEAMKDLLIQLGAKPPKNKYHNYKEFQEMKRQQREEAKAQNEWEREVGNKVTKRKEVEKRKRDWNDIGEIDGVIGKFKPGLLLLKKSDIHDLKRAKKTDTHDPKRAKKPGGHDPKRTKVKR